MPCRLRLQIARRECVETPVRRSPALSGGSSRNLGSHPDVASRTCLPGRTARLRDASPASIPVPGFEPFLVPRHHLLKLFAEAASDTQPCVASDESRESWRVTHAIGMHPMLVNENARQPCPARFAAYRLMQGADTSGARPVQVTPLARLGRNARDRAQGTHPGGGPRHAPTCPGGRARFRFLPLCERESGDPLAMRGTARPGLSPARRGSGTGPALPAAPRSRASAATGLASCPSADTMTRSAKRQTR